MVRAVLSVLAGPQLSVIRGLTATRSVGHRRALTTPVKCVQGVEKATTKAGDGTNFPKTGDKVRQGPTGTSRTLALCKRSILSLRSILSFLFFSLLSISPGHRPLYWYPHRWQEVRQLSRPRAGQRALPIF
jgi:hypothetical protein